MKNLIYWICCWLSSTNWISWHRFPIKFCAYPSQQWRIVCGFFIFWSFSTGTDSIFVFVHLIFGQHHSLISLSTSSCSITRTVSSRISSCSQTLGPVRIPSGSESINRHREGEKKSSWSRRGVKSALDRTLKFSTPFTDFTMFSLVAIFAFTYVRCDTYAKVLAWHNTNRPAFVCLRIHLVIFAALRYFSVKSEISYNACLVISAST